MIHKLHLNTRGVISLIGAGGKTSLMFQLAKELTASGKTVLTTTTTKIFMPGLEDSPHTLIADTVKDLVEKSRSCLHHYPHFSAGRDPASTPGKLNGFSRNVINQLWQSNIFDWIIVEADGARGRPLKASDSHEPVIPEVTTHLILITGLDAVGKSLDDSHVHRARLFSNNTGLALGKALDESAIAMGIAIEMKKASALCHPFFTSVCLNKADTSGQIASGQKIGRLLQAKKDINQIMITSLKDKNPVKECFDYKKTIQKEEKIMTQNIYTLAYELLSSGQKIVLVRTIRRSGSTPRDVGSMCIITEQGDLFGTVGGGALEYKAQQKAMALFGLEESFIYQFHLSNEDLAENGMICGGDVDLYLEPLFPSNKGMVSVYEAIQSHIIGNRPGTLVTRIKDGIHAMDKGARLFIEENGTTRGALTGFDPEKAGLDQDRPYDLIASDDKELDFFVEKIVLNPQVFLFGAGHVATVVARLAKMVGFDITVIDDRSEFANTQRFPTADALIISDFKHAFDQLKISQNSYILIITRGHLHDKIVLEQALSTPASYIGMIGSIRKRNIIYKDLMDRGISKESLENVFSPIGLDINAETPEEIAVSIVGELIQKRAPKKKNKALIL